MLGNRRQSKTRVVITTNHKLRDAELSVYYKLTAESLGKFVVKSVNVYSKVRGQDCGGTLFSADAA